MAATHYCIDQSHGLELDIISCSSSITCYYCRYDLEDAFTKFGPVKNVWVARRPPGFAFVEMEDPRYLKVLVIPDNG